MYIYIYLRKAKAFIMEAKVKLLSVNFRNHIWYFQSIFFFITSVYLGNSRQITPLGTTWICLSSENILIPTRFPVSIRAYDYNPPANCTSSLNSCVQTFLSFFSQVRFLFSFNTRYLFYISQVDRQQVLY